MTPPGAKVPVAGPYVTENSPSGPPAFGPCTTVLPGSWIGSAPCVVIVGPSGPLDRVFWPPVTSGLPNRPQPSCCGVFTVTWVLVPVMPAPLGELLTVAWPLLSTVWLTPESWWTVVVAGPVPSLPMVVVNPSAVNVVVCPSDETVAPLLLVIVLGAGAGAGAPPAGFGRGGTFASAPSGVCAVIVPSGPELTVVAGPPGV